jgi:tetratricopeptide (TPR) repeat protein
MNLGLALGGQGKLEEAIAEFRRMIERNPKYPKAHVNLGMALYKSGQYDDAIGEYYIGIELDPKNSTAYHNLGAVLHKTGNLTGARKALGRALELAPTFETSHKALRTVLEDAGDVAGERAELERWASVKLNDAAAWNALAWFLVNPDGKPEQRDPPAALPAARKAVELSKGKDPAILDTLAHVLYLTGDGPGALDTEEKAVALARGLVKPNPRLVASLEQSLARFRGGDASRPESDAGGASRPTSAPAK